MENMRKSKIEMHTFLLCTDVPFLGITRSVLNQLHVTPSWSIPQPQPWQRFRRTSLM